MQPGGSGIPHRALWRAGDRGRLVVNEVQKRMQTSAPSPPQGHWLRSRPSSFLWVLEQQQADPSTPPHLLIQASSMSVPAGGDVGCRSGCPVTDNQSAPASTGVQLLGGWMEEDGGVHTCPYSTVRASGLTPVPCQNSHGSSHCSSTRPPRHGPGNSPTSWTGGRTIQEVGRRTALV